MNIEKLDKYLDIFHTKGINSIDLDLLESLPLRVASEQAFEIASEQLGISKAELGDYLVEDMGFIDGYMPLEYGDELYKLYLESNLKLIIQKPDGKVVKSLPKIKEKKEFYHLGVIKRGKYVYDELQVHKGLRYKPKELSKRVVSELLLEIKDALK